VILSLSHDASIPSNEDALALVKHLRFVFGSPIPALPSNASSLLSVELVNRLSHIAEVGYSIVGSVMVYVINNFRLLAVHEKPSKPMGAVLGAIDTDHAVPFSVNRTSGPVVAESSKNARAGVVIKDIAYRIRYKFCSHSELLLSVVRGAVVGATVAPILTWEHPLGK
jgi:hypothetical protein